MGGTVIGPCGSPRPLGARSMAHGSATQSGGTSAKRGSGLAGSFGWQDPVQAELALGDLSWRDIRQTRAAWRKNSVNALKWSEIRLCRTRSILASADRQPGGRRDLHTKPGWCSGVRTPRETKGPELAVYWLIAMYVDSSDWTGKGEALPLCLVGLGTTEFRSAGCIWPFVASFAPAAKDMTQ